MKQLLCLVVAVVLLVAKPGCDDPACLITTADLICACEQCPTPTVPGEPASCEHPDADALMVSAIDLRLDDVADLGPLPPLPVLAAASIDRDQPHLGPAPPDQRRPRWTPLLI